MNKKLARASSAAKLGLEESNSVLIDGIKRNIMKVSKIVNNIPEAYHMRIKKFNNNSSQDPMASKVQEHKFIDDINPRVASRKYKKRTDSKDKTKITMKLPPNPFLSGKTLNLSSSHHARSSINLHLKIPVIHQ